MPRAVLPRRGALGTYPIIGLPFPTPLLPVYHVSFIFFVPPLASSYSRPYSTASVCSDLRFFPYPTCTLFPTHHHLPLLFSLPPSLPPCAPFSPSSRLSLHGGDETRAQTLVSERRDDNYLKKEGRRKRRKQRVTEKTRERRGRELAVWVRFFHSPLPSSRIFHT